MKKNKTARPATSGTNTPRAHADTHTHAHKLTRTYTYAYPYTQHTHTHAHRKCQTRGKEGRTLDPVVMRLTLQLCVKSLGGGGGHPTWVGGTARKMHSAN